MSDKPDARLRRIFDEVLHEPGRKQQRRHPAEVTSDRLGDAVSRWNDRFSGEEKDMIATIRHRLEEIAGGDE